MVFGSYACPLAVLRVVPFAFMGAACGHFPAGFDFTILSVASLIGSSGIVVNDAMVLITAVAERNRFGATAGDAVEDTA